jgi:PAS domain S-box-containing protein
MTMTELDPSFLHAAPNGAERRRRRPASKADVVLHELPARIVLDCLPTPIIVAKSNGITAYANPACAALLGHKRPARLKGQPLPDLLVGHAKTPPQHCVELLRATQNTVTEWFHADGYPITALASGSILRRAKELLVLVSIVDITKWRWEVPEEFG